jgi:hypothetical protein
MHQRSDAGLHEVSNRRTVVPMTIWSPSASFRSRTVAPLTRVPLVELRSTTTTSPQPPDLRMPATGVGVGDQDRALGQPADGDGLGSEHDREPSASTMEAAGRPAGPSRPRRRCRTGPGAGGVLHHRHGDRPHEDVVLRAGVLAGRLFELPHQGVEKASRSGRSRWRRGARRKRWAR